MFLLPKRVLAYRQSVNLFFNAVDRQPKKKNRVCAFSLCQNFIYTSVKRSRFLWSFYVYSEKYCIIFACNTRNVNLFQKKYRKNEFFWEHDLSNYEWLFLYEHWMFGKEAILGWRMKKNGQENPIYFNHVSRRPIMETTKQNNDFTTHR